MSMFIVTGEGVIGIEPVNSAHSERVRGAVDDRHFSISPTDAFLMHWILFKNFL